MAFDECTKFPATSAETEASMALSMRWASRSRRAFRARPGCGIFGIVQGGIYPELRQISARALRDIGFDGYAVGGLAIAEGQGTMCHVPHEQWPRPPAGRPP